MSQRGVMLFAIATFLSSHPTTEGRVESASGWSLAPGTDLKEALAAGHVVTYAQLAPERVRLLVRPIPSALVQMTSLLVVGAPTQAPAPVARLNVSAEDARVLVLVETQGVGGQRSHALTPVAGAMENITGSLTIGLVVGSPAEESPMDPVLIDFSVEQAQG